MHSMAKEKGIIPIEIEEIDHSQVDPVTFYRENVLKSKPVLIRSMVRDWPAFTLWSQSDYIKQRTSEIKIRVERTDRLSNDFAYFKKNDQFSRQVINYSEFLTSLQDQDRQFNYYFAE